MSREPNIPLLLWISTAILAHLATGGGVDQVARLIEERSELRTFARSVRERLQPPATIELGFETEPAVSPPSEPQKPEDALSLQAKRPEPKKQPSPKLEKQPEPKKQAIVLPKLTKPDPAEAAPAPPPPPPQIDHRIAVKQHVTPDQEDNPTAKFVGDEANHVSDESVARITSHDQDDPNPTPGGHHSGPDGEPGNSDHNRVGESDEHPGDPTRAPGEKGRTPDLDHATKAPPAPAVALNSDLPKTPPAGREPGRPPSSPTPAPPAAPPAPASPNTVSEADGNYRLDPLRTGPEGAAAPDNPHTTPEPPARSRIRMLGLGGAPTPGGINLNLSPQAVVAVVGQDQLTRERQADGERRKTAHRGSWQASGFERWRSAIENYVASVKPGNQTALNTARVPFAGYLNSIHNRIHPIFADDFLGSLDGLGGNNPLNDPRLITALEIVVSRDDGHVVRMGVTKTSGITAFDVAALDSVQRASPFGKPPGAIVSPDGNVYFHWEFHRDPVYACSTTNARPFLISAPPHGTDPEKQHPPGPSLPSGDPREKGSPPPPASREGLFVPPTRNHRRQG
jgi:hypothetical protein